MSESVSYRMRALSGKAGEIIQINLAKRGILFHDQQAWSTAKDRVEQLQAALQQELEKYPNSDPCRQENLPIEKGWSRADAMLRSFCSVPIFEAYAEKTRANELQAIREEVGIVKEVGLRTRREEAEDSLHQIQKRIEDLASVVQKELCHLEKEALLATASDALADLGYSLERNGGAMKASMNRYCVWMEANAWGEISLDFSGFSGFSCLGEVQKAEKALSQKGIQLTRTSSEFHGRPEGGVLTGRLEPLFPVFKRMKGEQSQETPCRSKIKIGG
ncbi:MAG: hypothetical protein FJ115_00030 [Deltaproteobacteria bacterium]|nr:hypothetical protein [Deltaproteobacteria bacterium]MBM4321916.1 hypothetical protein [Deltaproteobacteria bacterium]